VNYLTQEQLDGLADATDEVLSSLPDDWFEQFMESRELSFGLGAWTVHLATFAPSPN
jgi:hypothetical protein